MYPNNSAGPSSGSSGTTNGKKRRTNVGKACENCRRRRVKCDGVRPSCGTCGVYKDECQWEAREDYRKPLSRQQVQALVMRCQDLERLLREHGLQPGTSTQDPYAANVNGNGHGHGHSHGERTQVEKVETKEIKTGYSLEQHDPRDLSLDHLVEREDGDIHLHGPTSAFRHLGKYPTTTTYSLNVYPVPSQQTPLPIGFTRYLPSDIPLSEVEHNKCIDRFFNYYACWGLRTNVLHFKHDMALAVFPPFARTAHYSPLLHNAILAIALGFSDEPFLRHPAARKVFSAHAKSFIDEEGMTPSVATVQALAHIASYHSLGAEHNLGWLYIGMAVRCAVALGLNTDGTRLVEQGHVSVEQAIERDTTFWTIFIQEGLWAPYIGRSINLPAFTTQLPVVDPVLDQLEWQPLSPGTEAVLPRQPSLLSTTFVQTVDLMMIGERIMNTLYGIKVDLSTLQRTAVISDISLALSNWLDQLPHSLALIGPAPSNALPHILMMHLSHAWLVILLNRPFYRPLARLPASSTNEVEATRANQAAWAVKQCDKAASHVIHLLQLWERYHDLRISPPTALQICFVAGTTHLLSLASARSNSRRELDSLSRVDQCAALMDIMAKSWPAAAQAKSLLESLRDEYGLSGRNRADQPTTVRPPIGTNQHLEHSALHANKPEVGVDALGNTQQGLAPGSSAGIAPATAYNPTLAPTRDIFSPLAEADRPIGAAYPSPFDFTASNPMSEPFDWHEYDFGFSGNGVEDQNATDPEMEALLNTILQPHLSVGLGSYDQSHAPFL